MTDNDKAGSIRFGGARKLTINTFFTVASRALSLVVVIWMHRFLVQNVSAAEYAVWPVILSVMIFAPIITNTLTASVARYVVTEIATGKEGGVERVISSIYPAIVLATILALLAGFIIAENVGTLLSLDPAYVEDASLMLKMLVVSHCFETLLLPLGVGLFAKEKFVTIGAIRLGQELVKSGLIVLLLLIAEPRVIWVVVGTALGTICASSLQALLSLRATPEIRFRYSAISIVQLKTMVSFGTWGTVGFLASRIQSSADPLILNQFGDPTDVVAYNVGTMPDRQINSLYSAAIAPLAPILIAKHVQGDNEGLRDLFIRVNRYFLWGTLAVAVQLVALAEPLATLYIGSEYSIIVPLIMLVYGAYVFRFSNALLYNVVMAKNDLARFTSLAVGMQLVSVVLSLYFVGYLRMGALGAGCAYLIGAAASQIFIFWPYGCRITLVDTRSFLRLVVAPGSIPFFVGILFSYSFQLHSITTTWASLVASSAYIAIVYLVAMLLTIWFSNDDSDRTLLVKAAHRLLRHSGNAGQH